MYLRVSVDLRLPLYHLTTSCSSIFVIHGLRGGATSSWRHPDTGNVWFQHLLPEYIRTHTNTDSARIWTYGYPADVTFQAASVYELGVALLKRIKDARKGYEVRPPFQDPYVSGVLTRRW